MCDACACRRRRRSSLDREEFKYGLIDYGLPLSDEEFDMILGYFDRNKDGSISLTEFLVAVRGEMNDRRMGFVHEAFRRLDKDGSGRVTLADLVGVYDASFHPEVKAGTKTQDQVLREVRVRARAARRRRGGGGAGAGAALVRGRNVVLCAVPGPVGHEGQGRHHHVRRVHRVLQGPVRVC